MSWIEAPDNVDWTTQGPGVYFIEKEPVVPRAMRTGVPAFLVRGAASSIPVRVTSARAGIEVAAQASRSGMFAAVIMNFFANGGEVCWVVWAHPAQPATTAFQPALRQIEELSEIDLVCAPDLCDDPDCIAGQQQILEHCDALKNRFAILDAASGADLASALDQWRSLTGRNAALYFPRLRTADNGNTDVPFIPPCGHVAGIYAREDHIWGVFKAPANVALEGVSGVEFNLDGEDQKRIDPHRAVNLIRAFPGRGFRIWGARTTSGQEEWKYVNVSRLFITISRWFEFTMSDLEFEPNTPRLWGRMERRIRSELDRLFRQGALKGARPEEAFYVKCDRETNPPSRQETGEIVAELGLAPAIPSQFVIVRLSVRRTSAVTASANS